MKFILKEPLTWGITRSYNNAAQAKSDPLAAAALRHRARDERVLRRSLDYRDAGRQADWQALLRELAKPIREAPAADDESARFAAQAAMPEMPPMSEADQERLDKINELLDEQVRPYLQGDGGDLYVLGLQGNTLTVHYQGACGSCPSSMSGTLAGIESLVRQFEPDIEVVAV